MGPPRRLVRRPALRLPARHHHDGEGHHQRVRADGRRDRLRPRRRAVPRGHELVHPRLHVRRPPDVAPRSRWPTSTSSRTRASSRTCARTRARSARMLESLRDIPIVGDVRGAGYFHAHRARQGPRDARSRFTHEESETLLRGFLSRRAVPPRADLPRRRPRRPGHPALAAAHRRARAVRGDRVASCGRCSRRPRERMHVARVGEQRDAHRPRAPRATSTSASLAGEASLDAPVRWVHISELRRPDAVALGRRAAADDGHAARHGQAPARRSSRALADHGLAGLGLGTGFAHDARARGDDRGGATSADFPLFEVPYEVPFIAVTEKAFTRLVNEQYALLQRSIAAQERLQRIVLSERGLDAIVAALATLIGGAALVFDGRGELQAQRRVPPRARRRGGRGARRPSCASARAAATAAASCPAHPELAAARARAAGRRARRAPTAALAAGVARGRQGRRRPGRVRPPDPAPGGDGRRARAAAPPRRRRRPSAGWPATCSSGRRQRRARRAPSSRAASSRSGSAAASPRSSSPPGRAGRAPAPCEAALAEALRDEAVGGLVAGAGALRLRAAARLRSTTSSSSWPSACVARVARRARRRRARRAPAAPCRRATRASAYHEARCALEARELGARRGNGAGGNGTPRRGGRGSRPTATSAPSSCCSRCRTPTRCGCSATRCSGRSRTARATTAAS